MKLAEPAETADGARYVFVRATRLTVSSAITPLWHAARGSSSTNNIVEEPPAPLHIRSSELASHTYMSDALVERTISPFKSLLYAWIKIRAVLATARQTL